MRMLTKLALLVAVYDRALIVALRHRRVTLGVMLATVAATVWLYVVIAKGFFPQQDTGIIMGVSEAAQDISPDGMKQRQQAILEIASRDPAVASAVGYIGPGGPTVTENDGRWIPTRSATPSTALVPQRKVGFPIPNAGLLLGFQGTKTVRREGISSPFSDARGCTSPQNSGAASSSPLSPMVSGT